MEAWAYVWVEYLVTMWALYTGIGLWYAAGYRLYQWGYKEWGIEPKEHALVILAKVSERSK